MLNKQNRIKRKKDFNYIYRKSKRIYHNSFVIYILFKSKTPQFGFSVSKKVGKAVGRNKIKRRLSEIIRCNISNIKPCRIIIQAQKPIVDMSFNELKREIDFLFLTNDLYLK